MRSRYDNKKLRRVADIVSVACALFYVVFALRYLCFYQRDILALQHFVSQSDASSFSAFGSALICIIVFALPALALQKLRYYPVTLRALAWYPSFSALSLITSCSIANDGQVEWSFIGGILFCIISILAQFCTRFVRPYSNEHRTIPFYISVNALFLIFPVLLTFMTSNTDISTHNALKSERLLQQGKVEECLNVGRTERWNTSPNLTSVHALVLSRQGILTEDIIGIPCHSDSMYRPSESLIPKCTPVSEIYGTLHKVNQHLGYTRKNDKISVRSFLIKAMEKEAEVDTSALNPRPFLKRLRNYYIASLIVDNDMNELARAVAEYNDSTIILPEYIRMALEQ